MNKYLETLKYDGYDHQDRFFNENYDCDGCPFFLVVPDMYGTGDSPTGHECECHHADGCMHAHKFESEIERELENTLYEHDWLEDKAEQYSDSLNDAINQSNCEMILLTLAKMKRSYIIENL